MSLRQPPHRGQHQRPGKAGSAVFHEVAVKTTTCKIQMNESAAFDNFNDPLLGSNFKGYPRTQPPRRRSEVGAAGWNVLAAGG